MEDYLLNISSICSHDQYIHAADSYLRGIERRINEGLNPAVTVFVSISTSYLVEALSKEIDQDAATQLIIAAARKIYRAMRMLHISQKWERAYNGGGRILRIIWVHSGEKHSSDSEHLLINNIIAPLTVTLISADVLKDFSHCGHSQTLMPKNGDDCDKVLARSEKTGINFEHLATCFQKDLAKYQITDWIMLLDALARRSATIIQNQNLRTEGDQR